MQNKVFMNYLSYIKISLKSCKLHKHFIKTIFKMIVCKLSWLIMKAVDNFQSANSCKL